MNGQDANVEQIVQAVLQHDDEPPSDEYSPYDYGWAVGRTLSEGSAASLVAECLRVLPGSLASSFLDGVLDSASIPNLEDVLFDVLPHAREVSSASPIVGYLLEKCKHDPVDLVTRLLSRIQQTSDEGAQNRLAYALWFPVRD